MRDRGQTSLEILLVVSFGILLSMMIAIPFLSNQARTEAAIQAKLAVLPLIERNSELLRISSMTAVGTPYLGSQELTVTVNTKGEMDSVIVNELSAGKCQSICEKIDTSSLYQQVSFVWVHNSTVPAVCSLTC